MKMRKLSLLLIFLLVFALAGCGTKKAETKDPVTDVPEKATEAPTSTPVEQPKKDIPVAVLKGATALGMLQLMEKSEQQLTTNNYQFQVAGAADEITAGIIKGEIPIAAIPCNLASVLYNKSKGGVTMLAINNLGVLSIVESGDTVHSIEDLKGKTIYSTGKGTTPEFTLRELLLSASIDPDQDVTIEYKSEATEVAALLSKMDNAVAMLPQPYVTTVQMNNEKVRVALDVTKEWEEKKPGTTVVTGVVVVNTKFLNENKEAVMAFLEEYKASAAYASEYVEETAALSEKYGIFKAAVAKRAIPYCNIVAITGEDMQKKAEAYLSVLFEQNANAVGGALPAAEFYFK